MAELNFPTEIVELPSKGLIYPEGHPLRSGKVEMKYMTAREEDILTNQNYIRQGIVIDKLLQSLLITKFDYDDLLIGDKDAIMLSARILGYGKNYTFEYLGEDVTIDLTLLKEKSLDKSKLISTNANEFSFVLPHTDNTITFKLLTQKDEKNIEAEIEGLKKINKEANNELTTRLKHMILSINGNYDQKSIREFVDNAFLARDSRAFREYYNAINPGVDTKIKHEFIEGVEEDVNVQFGINFFWPDA
jgi:hypothetical protein